MKKYLSWRSARHLLEAIRSGVIGRAGQISTAMKMPLFMPKCSIPPSDLNLQK